MLEYLFLQINRHILLELCPSAVCIVRAKHDCIGNSVCWRGTTSASEKLNVILGIMTVSFLNTNQFLWDAWWVRDPLQSLRRLRFLIKMMEDPIINSILCGGNPRSSTESRNSVGKWVALVPSLSALKEQYTLIIPLKCLMQVELIFLILHWGATKMEFFEYSSAGLSLFRGHRSYNLME